MKRMALVLFLLCSSASASEVNPDLAELLDRISAICGKRWALTIGENDMVYLNSEEKALGEAAGYSYPIGEDEYTLHFRFKIVREITVEEAAVRRQRLEALRKQGKKIKHTQSKGYFNYQPVGEEQWALVLKIKKAEQEVEEIPEFQYKSVCLSQEYSMSLFIPNKNNKKALQYKKDINAIYELLKKAPNKTDQPDKK